MSVSTLRLARRLPGPQSWQMKMWPASCLEHDQKASVPNKMRQLKGFFNAQARGLFQAPGSCSHVFFLQIVHKNSPVFSHPSEAKFASQPHPL